ncbi:MAG: hypothetical protein HGA85_08825, partial [Nanoarchaeota archaeon]|nr:hypothetical protein [Nanoarchaeota archaeon]
YEFPSENMQDPTDTELKENYEKYDIKPLPSRKIAGYDALCFGYTNEDVNYEYCYSEKGIPLYMKTVAKGSSAELTATDVKTSVADSEFVLPASPQKLPSIPNY